ncbi:HD domain-containing protein [Streptomyces huiliensis]|uniref:HD domain-containing protein n=1 Tax=Streptomyces huiliensis TaxID=2876027 RepID=UPI001CBE63BE|nr:hypothetical protein [Streptomyces huiliensis]MBZ4322812.1 hypothetical protein [Streptomyces huiliensis]
MATPTDPSLETRWADAVAAARGPESDGSPKPDGGPKPDGSPKTDDGPDPARYAADLLTRWSEPQRRYHTTAHLTAVLDRVDELAEHAETPRDLAAVRLAAWFHDAVYLPERSTNEERSARLAGRALAELGIPEDVTAEVVRLVLLTVGHDPAPGDRNGELLCDADLAVLGGAPEAYATYAAEVRQEYGFVPDEAFRAGRAAVLRQLLGLPRLFRTPRGYERWERAARHNLTTELALLTT